MKKQNFTNAVKIAIVGVGGGGCNTINHIFFQSNQYIAQGDFDYVKELMGDDLTEETFQRLGIETIAEIAKYIAQIKGTEISKYIAQMKGTDKAIGVFAIFKSNQFIMLGGFEFAKELLIRTFGEKEAKKVLEKLVKSMQTIKNFAYLSKVSPKQLADFLANEHPQTIALIVANMDSNSATEMLSYFSDEERADIADKRESIDNISPQIVKRVSNILENKLESLMNCKVEVRKAHIALDTDKMALLNSVADSHIQLGEKITQGFGAGMNPELGAKSAEESYDLIKEALQDSNIVLITAGLGGGTGTGALPIVAQIAKEIGALTIAVVTMPFSYEGKMREKIAQNGLDEIKKVVDSFFVLPNEKLLSTIDKTLGMVDTLKIIDSILAKSLLGLANILSDNNGGLNIDLADLKIAMENKGLGFIGVGEKDGEDSAVEAIKEAMQSPLFDSNKTRGAKCAIIHYTINEKYLMHEIAMANEIVQQQLDEDAFCKMGWTWDNTLNPNQVKVTLIITGLKNA